MVMNLGLSLIVGAIPALAGAGGGILAVPLLGFDAHLSVAQAGSIGLLAVGMAATLGAVLGLRAKIVRYKAAALIAVTGMLLSPFGLWLAHRIDNRCSPGHTEIFFYLIEVSRLHQDIFRGICTHRPSFSPKGNTTKNSSDLMKPLPMQRNKFLAILARRLGRMKQRV